LHHRTVGLDEDGAVVQVVAMSFAEGVAAEFASLVGEVVAPRNLGFEAVGTQSILNDRKLLRHVIQFFVGDKREVDVAEVVVDSTAARASSHEVATFVQE